MFSFYPRINKPNIHNNIDILSFQNRLNNLSAKLGFILRAKLWKLATRGKIICFLILRHFLSKCTFLRLWQFCLAFWLSNQLSFLVAVRIYKIHAFDEALFLLTIRMPMVTKGFRVVTCCEELSLINKHDITTEWSCGVMWQIKYIK